MRTCRGAPRCYEGNQSTPGCTASGASTRSATCEQVAMRTIDSLGSSGAGDRAETTTRKRQPPLPKSTRRGCPQVQRRKTTKAHVRVLKKGLLSAGGAGHRGHGSVLAICRSPLQRASRRTCCCASRAQRTSGPIQAQTRSFRSSSSSPARGTTVTRRGETDKTGQIHSREVSTEF